MNLVQKTLKVALFSLMAFVVVWAGSAQAEPSKPYQLKLMKRTYAPGESIDVSFKVEGALPKNAWVGIIPSDVTHGSEAHNDQYDISYQYLNGARAGELTFTAPSKPGRYDFRLHNTDSNGRELTYVSFVVGDEAVESSSSEDIYLSLPKKAYYPGEPIVVNFKADPSFENNAWVGIIPSAVSHGSESHNDEYDMTYQYLEGRTEGALRFNAPSEPGRYDFRMHNTDNDGDEMYSVTFTVR